VKGLAERTRNGEGSPGTEREERLAVIAKLLNSSWLFSRRKQQLRRTKDDDRRIQRRISTESRPTKSRTLRSTATAELRRGCTILSSLDNTLLSVLYPGIKVAERHVPTEPLDDFEESQVENTLAKLTWRGVHYKLVGASGSAKKGKFYFVDQAHSRSIAERFQHWAAGCDRLLRDPTSHPAKS